MPGAWLWHVDPEIEGPCLQGSHVSVFLDSSQGNGRGQSCVPSAGRGTRDGRASGPSSGANDLLELVNSRIRFPRQCTIPMECTPAMREVDIAMGWKLVDSPQVNRLNNPACLLHWRVLMTTLQWLDRTLQEAVREYTPVLSDSICRYVPSPVNVVQEAPTCVVEEPEDWMKDYPDTPSQPFQLREYRSGQLIGVMASSIRDLQTLALHHFSVWDPVIATMEPP